MKPREPIDLLEQVVPRTGTNSCTATLFRVNRHDALAVQVPEAFWEAYGRMWLLRIRR